MGYYRNSELVKKARELRRNMTLAEILLWSKLRSKQLDGYKFRRQYPIFDYIVDFYCHELKFIIEVDGGVHALRENEMPDRKREKLLKINGYNIIRFSNYAIESNINSCLNKIRIFINNNSVPLSGGPQGF